MSAILRVACGIWIAVLAECTFGQGSAAEAPVLTVCEALKSRAELNGRTLVLVGKLVGTDEGLWLEEDCDEKIVSNGYTWRNVINLSYLRPAKPAAPEPPKDFDWGRGNLRSKLQQVQRTTRLNIAKESSHSDKWFAVFGRFETLSPLLTAVDARGVLRGAGFGHLGMAPAQLIAKDQAGYHELKPE